MSASVSQDWVELHADDPDWSRVEARPDDVQDLWETGEAFAVYLPTFSCHWEGVDGRSGRRGHGWGPGAVGLGAALRWARARAPRVRVYLRDGDFSAGRFKLEDRRPVWPPEDLHRRSGLCPHRPPRLGPDRTYRAMARLRLELDDLATAHLAAVRALARDTAIDRPVVAVEDDVLEVELEVRAPLCSVAATVARHAVLAAVTSGSPLRESAGERLRLDLTTLDL